MKMQQKRVGRNFELGWRYVLKRLNSIQLYYMAYKNQLILTGSFDDVGAPIRFNNSEKVTV
jgi:iron complex outermembrane receptor protein